MTRCEVGAGGGGGCAGGGLGKDGFGFVKSVGGSLVDGFVGGSGDDDG